MTLEIKSSDTHQERCKSVIWTTRTGSCRRRRGTVCRVTSINAASFSPSITVTEASSVRLRRINCRREIRPSDAVISRTAPAEVFGCTELCVILFIIRGFWPGQKTRNRGETDHFMKVGIIGLSQTGKTSLFNALTRSQVELNRFGGTEVSVAVIAVPDPRFDYAVENCKPKKVTPASIEFTEGGARIERGERQGQGEKFGTDFFAAVRNMDALVLVARAFDSPLVEAPAGGINPLLETEKILEELLLADLTVIETRLEKLEKARLQKRQSNAEAAEHQVLEKIKAHLDAM